MIELSLDSTNFWIQFGASLFALGGGLWGAVRMFHRLMVNSVEESLVTRLEEIRLQQVPNHGGSLRDAIDRIEAKLDGAVRDIERHLGYHAGLNHKEQ